MRCPTRRTPSSPILSSPILRRDIACPCHPRRGSVPRDAVDRHHFRLFGETASESPGPVKSTSGQSEMEEREGGGAGTALRSQLTCACACTHRCANIALDLQTSQKSTNSSTARVDVVVDQHERNQGAVVMRRGCPKRQPTVAERVVGPESTTTLPRCIIAKMPTRNGRNEFYYRSE